ncbi:MAG: hypothetical protein JJD92_09950 [Frankiaceae bacterium]|nr:hypothetical protein [Frankiaceae bacterium]
MLSRPLFPGRVVAPPGGTSCGTRLRVTVDERALLRVIGEHLAAARGGDLGAALRGEPQNDRVQSLCARFGIQARYAGSIVRANDAQVRLAREGLWRHKLGLQRGVTTLEGRLVARTRRECGCGQRRGCEACKDGYPNRNEWWPSVGVWTQEEAGLVWLTVSVPEPVQRRLGVPARVRLTHPAPIGHLPGLVERVTALRSTAISISFEHGKRGEKVMLRASWTHEQTPPVPDLRALRAGRVVALDLNADHLALSRLNPDGNPVGPPVRIPLELKALPAGTRDARTSQAHGPGVAAPTGLAGRADRRG